MAESAMSSISKVADEVHMARIEAATVAAEAESAKGILQSQSASFSVQVEASAERAVERMEGCVQQLVLYTDAQTSRVAGKVI